jgi:hypothetical protein
VYRSIFSCGLPSDQEIFWFDVPVYHILRMNVFYS